MAVTKFPRDQLIGAIDTIDLGAALLRTAWLATTAESGVLDDDIEAITATLYHALAQMKPGRDALQKVVEDLR